MAITNSVFVSAKELENTQTTQYTSTSLTSVIDKCTVTNITSSNVTLSVNLVSSGGSASNSNLILKDKVIIPDETYLCSELIGHVLEDGGFISTLAGTASSLVMRVSGRKIS